MQVAQAITVILNQSTVKNLNPLPLLYLLLMFLTDLPLGGDIMELANIPSEVPMLALTLATSLTPEKSQEFPRTLST